METKRARRRREISDPPGVRFATPSERAFARLLDFYRVSWQYEPRAFDLEWDADGRVVEQFSPDFYLPELDLYVELTMMKQSLVTRKNRKLRRLRELYPEVQVKLLYSRDMRQLFGKYGLRVDKDEPPGGAGAG